MVITEISSRRPAVAGRPGPGAGSGSAAGTARPTSSLITEVAKTGQAIHADGRDHADQRSVPSSGVSSASRPRPSSGPAGRALTEREQGDGNTDRAEEQNGQRSETL